MKRTLRLASLVIIGALLLSACTADPGDTAPVTPSPAAAVQEPAAARQESHSADADEVTTRRSNPPAPRAITDTGLAAGQDYIVIPGGHPYVAQGNRVEVVEVFGYVCPACARFHPLVSSWAKTLPGDVAFRYIPAPFGPDWDPYARGFYVADAMGLVPRTHDALINAIHVAHSMPGEGQKPTDEAVAKFYAGYGVDADNFLSQMRSFANEARMRRGKQFLAQSGIEGTPTLIVAGKYRVLGKTYRDSLRIADQLIDTERRKRSGAAHQ